MPNIIDKSYFQKANELNIPLSVSVNVANPTLNSPNNATALDELCVKVEKSILLNALGLTAYNELQLALADLDNPLYASYKKLVEGEEYDGKVWEGLNNDYSLIAYSIYEQFLTITNDYLTGVGNTQGQPEKSTLISPKYKIANASANFIQKYQGGYLNEPIISHDGMFVDWFGQNNEVEVSLYRYLLDKELVDLSNFKVYEQKNTFGI